MRLIDRAGIRVASIVPTMFSTPMGSSFSELPATSR